jgi:hypothetical protein
MWLSGPAAVLAMSTLIAHVPGTANNTDSETTTVVR